MLHVRGVPWTASVTWWVMVVKREDGRVGKDGS